MQLNQASRGYSPLRGQHDEAVDERGQIRRAWSPLLEGIVQRSGGLSRLREQAVRILDESGASHLFPGNSTPTRPWELDPVPLLIDASEWRTLARGIAERAGVINAIAADAYGPGDLVRSGVLPAEVVFGHPGFARAGSPGEQQITGQPVVVYGADLVRAGTGEWRVLRDVTDAPSGIGYALLNRSVSSRVMPGVFRDVGATPLEPFLASLRSALTHLAPPDRGNPRVVVMSPGISHPSYLEHSYLASTLGYHLAETGDLLVRNGRLWLRTLGGLEAVDVVLRRSDDHSSDPLDLGGGGGVPGIARLSRIGGVGVANAIGSGLAGSLALHPFLDDVGHVLLGRNLSLSSIDSLWCGAPESLVQVISDFDSFVVHDVSPLDPVTTVFGVRLDDREREIWRHRLAADPTRFVAQRKLDLATTPISVGEALQPGHVTLRVLAVHDGESFNVFPGGLARVVDSLTPIVSQFRGEAKDVWIVDDNARRSSVRVIPRSDVPQIDLGSSLPTRAAEALFWVGRYLEQSESIARLGNVVLLQLQRDPDLIADPEVTAPALIGALLGGAIGRPIDLVGGSAGDDVLAAILAAAGGPGGLVDRLAGLRQAVGSVRQYVSDTSWHVLGNLDRAAHRISSQDHDPTALSELLSGVVVDLAAFAGLVADSMVRGPAWRLLDLGRRLERSLALLNMLESLVAPGGFGAPEPYALGLFLVANESLIAYRRRFRSDLELAATIDLLVTDDTNPRSLTFQFDRLREDFAALPERRGSEPLDHLLDAAARELTAATWSAGRGTMVAEGRLVAIDRLVTATRGPLLDMVDVLNQDWFSDRRSMRF